MREKESMRALYSSLIAFLSSASRELVFYKL